MSVTAYALYHHSCAVIIMTNERCRRMAKLCNGSEYHKLEVNFHVSPLLMGIEPLEVLLYLPDVLSNVGSLFSLCCLACLSVSSSPSKLSVSCMPRLCFYLDWMTSWCPHGWWSSYFRWACIGCNKTMELGCLVLSLSVLFFTLFSWIFCTVWKWRLVRWLVEHVACQ